MSAENSTTLKADNFFKKKGEEVARLEKSGQRRIDTAYAIEVTGVAAFAGGALSFASGIIIEALAGTGPHNSPEDIGFATGMIGLILFYAGGELGKKFKSDKSYNVATFIETGTLPGKK